jgi:hypothetical protein
MPIFKACPVCNEQFSCKPSHDKLRTYCSRPCMSKAYNKRREVICEVCGKPFKVANNKHRENAKFCSKTCMGQGKSGENHVMWKGGLRTDREYQRAVRKRDYPKYREKTLAYQKKRKLHLVEIPGSHTRKAWESLLDAYKGKCAYCGKQMTKEAGPDQITRDHVDPISKGGTDDITNILPACRSCNSSKNNRPGFVPLLVNVTDCRIQRQAAGCGPPQPARSHVLH